ncbi:MAG: mechanosensitive ion channel family protein, partial [Alphaproteobacteria bacterium]
MRDDTQNCVKSSEERVNATQESLDVLGEIQEGEEPSLAAKRKLLEKERLNAKSHLAECRLLGLRVREAQDRTEVQIKDLLANQLLHRSPPVWVVAARLAANPDFLKNTTDDLLTAGPARDDGNLLVTLAIFAAAAFAGLLVGSILARRMVAYLNRLSSNGVLARYGVCAARRMRPAFMALAIGLTALYLGSLVPAMLALPMAVYWIISPFIRALLCRGTDNDDPCRIAVALRPAIALALLWLAGISLGGTLDLNELSISAIRNLYAAIFAVLLVRIVLLVFSAPALSAWQVWRNPVMVAVLASPVAQFLGYPNLANFLFTGVTGSLGILALTIIVGRLIFQGLNSLNEGTTDFSTRLRERIGLKKDEHFPASPWIKTGTLISLIALVVLGIINAWQISDAFTNRVSEAFFEGLSVGDTEIVPVRIVLALVGFVAFMVLAKWLRLQMSERWLASNKIDSGAREAATNLSVYLLIAISILFSLNVAGIDTGKLAIIAGALSVGIGFGLQNIVNNFVSGIILFVERPVKEGDWVVVDKYEGYIKR